MNNIQELTQYLRKLADNGRITIPELISDDWNTALNQIDIQAKATTLTDAEIGWVDVNDRLPEFETDVLLFDNWKSRDGEQMKDIRVGYLSEYTKLKSSNGEVVSCEWKGTEFAFNITHWMPLPPTPTTTQLKYK